MNVLQLIQQARLEMGLTSPTSVVGNTDADVMQTYALLSALAGELVREYDWEALNTEYRFTTQFLITTGTDAINSAVLTGIPSTTGLDTTYMVTGTGINQDTYVKSVDSSSQVTMSQNASSSNTGTALTFGKTKYSMPADFDRQIDRTHYDKSKRWAMIGPETAQEWQFLKSSYISTGPRLRYRIMGGYFQIWPIIATPEYIGFEYVSNAFARDATGTAKTQFSADTDTCIFNDRLMIVGLKKKYFEIKGFDASMFVREYMRELSIAKANDSGSATLSFNPRLAEVLIGYDNLPDTGLGPQS